MSATVEKSPPQVEPPASGTSLKQRLAGFRLDRYGTLLFFLAFYVIIGAKEGSAYISWENISLVLSNNANVAVLAAAVTITLIAGQFDLSCGALAGMTAVLAAHWATTGMATGFMIILVLAVGAAAGFLNALLVTRAHVNAFIATLGTGGVFAGIALWVSKGQAIFGEMPKIFTDAGTTKLIGIPLPMVYLVLLLVALWALTKRTVIGRFWYAAGSNPSSAELAGVPVRRMTTYAFIATGMLAALAGILAVARFGAADPSSGPDLLLPAFAGAFLGSSILSDGRFTVVGSLLAACLIVFATNGLDVAAVNVAVKPMFNGAVLVGAVAITEVLRRRRKAGSLLPRAA
ncbi:MAG: ribose transport system permease protein [Solirubrobacteraceae bacterium]|jgi:ribose transport system permease protein|nr:ribose transport system permease protein [Solirubrobacteraceae bacterium]